MNMADFWDDPLNILVVVGGLVSVVLLQMIIYFSCYQRVPPNKAMVVYGRARYETNSFMEDGKMKTVTRRVGNRIIRGGGTFVTPIIERAGWLPLESTTIESKLAGVRTRDGETITVEIASQFKIKGDEESLRAAMENYLDKPMSHITESGRTILESRARLTLGAMTLAEITANREETGLKIAEKVLEDFRRSGLGIMAFNIMNVKVEKGAFGIIPGDVFKAGDMFKVVKNASGDLTVQKVTSVVEG